MATNFHPLISPIIIIAIIVLIFLARIQSSVKKEQKTIQYTSRSTHRRYDPQFSNKMEFDIRLPYRRFKQFYPHNSITYEEYKKLQMQSSFKRSLSSQQNHRMVR